MRAWRTSIESERRQTIVFVIAELCIGVKDTACVDVCPVDCIHPKKDTVYVDDQPGLKCGAKPSGPRTHSASRSNSEAEGKIGAK